MSTSSSTTRTHRSPRWRIGTVALAIVSAAMLAPSASAASGVGLATPAAGGQPATPDNLTSYTPSAPQNVGLPVGQPATPDNLTSYTPSAPQNVGLPGGQPATPDNLTSYTPSAPQNVGLSGGQVTVPTDGMAKQAPVESVSVVQTGGFDWGAAAAGFGLAAGAGLLAAAALTLRRRRTLTHTH